MAYEVFVRNVSSSLHGPFRSVVNFDRSQLIHSVKSTKMQETESKNESQFYITRKIFIT